MGAWALYGLGSASDNLPAYIVMADGKMRANLTLTSDVNIHAGSSVSVAVSR